MRALIATRDTLAAAGLAVELATDNLTCDTTDLGDAGLLLGTVYDYEIILLDLVRPNVEGYKMPQRLRAASVHADINPLRSRRA